MKIEVKRKASKARDITTRGRKKSVEYEVEQILQKRTRNNGVEFLIKYLNIKKFLFLLDGRDMGIAIILGNQNPI